MSIAIVNGSKGQRLDVTIQSHAYSNHLDCALVEVELPHSEQIALCRMGYVTVENLFHRNPVFQAQIAHHGRLEFFSELADTMTAYLDMISCVDQNGIIGPRRSAPRSGSEVNMLGTNALDKYRREQKYQAVIGHLLTHEDIPVSIVNRDFKQYGKKDNGGHGEAKHELFCGQNGSGKSVIASMKNAIQLAANPDMGCLVPDIAGDLSRKGSHVRGEFYFDWLQLLEDAGRDYTVLDIKDVALTSTAIYEEQIKEGIKKVVKTSHEKVGHIAEELTLQLFGSDPVDIHKASADDVIGLLIDVVERSFAKGGKARAEKLMEELTKGEPRYKLFTNWYASNIERLFTGKDTIRELLNRFMRKGEIIILRMFDCSREMQRLIMTEIFSQAKDSAESAFQATGQMVNAKIVLDEGPRWVPQDKRRGDNVASVVLDAFNTTRKLGLGWQIITQRLAAIDKAVVAQCHTTWFGRGLSMSADMDTVKSLVGDVGVQQYESMQMLDGYPWIGVGQEVNLGMGNQFVPMSPFNGNANEKIKAANPHIWGQTPVSF